MTEQIYNTSELYSSVIFAEIYPCGKSGFILYADDGKTNAYENGEFTLTEILCNESDKTVITAAASNELFSAKRVNLKIHVNAVPNSVRVNGEKAERHWHLGELKLTANSWFYDEFNRILYTAADLDGLYNEVVAEYTDEAVQKPIKGESIETGVQDIPSFIFNDSLSP